MRLSLFVNQKFSVRSFLVVFHLYSTQLGLPQVAWVAAAGAGVNMDLVCVSCYYCHTRYTILREREREISHMTRVKVEGKSHREKDVSVSSSKVYDLGRRGLLRTRCYVVFL